MSFTSMHAFVGLPVNPQGCTLYYARLAATPHRIRRGLLVSARSLDSYREGNRFDESHSTRRSREKHASSSGSSPGKSGKRETRPARPKLRVPLVNALCNLKVASLETCLFLIRSGCVRVNGEVVRDQKAKVHRLKDELTVNSKEYGTLVSHNRDKTASSASDMDVVDPELLPRGQRDFRNRQVPGPDSFKKYNRRVDRGFFSSRRFHLGK